MISSTDPSVFTSSTHRKNDHIQMALNNQTQVDLIDRRFFYEPLHFKKPQNFEFQLAGKALKNRFWISSMTGGTEMASVLNQRFAKLCGEFGLGMGLGSCRALLESDRYLTDFDVRELVSDQFPLFINLGMAQITEAFSQKSIDKIIALTDRLRADGLIIHLNPLQEWAQPEGDRIDYHFYEILCNFLSEYPYPVIVKEVGQGMGPQTLKSLMSLPLAAIDFAAFGGTNFSKIENSRNQNVTECQRIFEQVGHGAFEMVNFINEILKSETYACQKFIISGGVNNVLDAYYLTEKLNAPALVGQASHFLKYAMKDYASLRNYYISLSEAYNMAESFLVVRGS